MKTYAKFKVEWNLDWSFIFWVQVEWGRSWSSFLSLRLSKFEVEVSIWVWGWVRSRVKSHCEADLLEKQKYFQPEPELNKGLKMSSFSFYFNFIYGLQSWDQVWNTILILRLSKFKVGWDRLQSMYNLVCNLNYILHFMGGSSLSSSASDWSREFCVQRGERWGRYIFPVRLPKLRNTILQL